MEDQRGPAGDKRGATNTARTFRTQDEAPRTGSPQGQGSWAEPTDCSPDARAKGRTGRRAGTGEDRSQGQGASWTLVPRTVQEVTTPSRALSEED